MDDRTRKLSLAGLGVALFAGFVALTRWTGDDPGSVEALDDQEQGELAQFCGVFSSGLIPYELVLQGAAGLAVSPEESTDIGILDSGAALSLAESQIMMLADDAPEEYGADAQMAAEGLQRALEGDLAPDEVDEYLAAFERLEAGAAEDCDDVEQSPFGPDEGPRVGQDDEPSFG